MCSLISNLKSPTYKPHYFIFTHRFFFPLKDRRKKKAMSQAFSTFIHFFKCSKACKRRRNNASKMMQVKAAMLRASVPLRSCLGWSSHMGTGVCGSVLSKPCSSWLHQPKCVMWARGCHGEHECGSHPLRRRGSAIQISNAQMWFPWGKNPALCFA